MKDKIFSALMPRTVFSQVIGDYVSDCVVEDSDCTYFVSVRRHARGVSGTVTCTSQTEQYTFDINSGKCAPNSLRSPDARILGVVDGVNRWGRELPTGRRFPR